MTQAHAHTQSYLARRGELETYFDRTAAEGWKRLMSDAPLKGVRATVQAGRNAMRALILSWLPADMSGMRLLDAGCGAGQLALEAAARGADVVAVDLSRTLLALAQERADAISLKGRVRFLAGDMLDAGHGQFDHVVAMDSVIHYGGPDRVRAIAGLCARASGSVVFTFAPANALLSTMHAAGKLFPRADRSPAIVPVGEARLRADISASPALAGFAPARTQRVKSGFYISQAMELLAR